MSESRDLVRLDSQIRNRHPLSCSRVGFFRQGEVEMRRAAVASMPEGEDVTRIEIEALADHRLVIVSPFCIEAHREPEGVTVLDPDSGVFGSGSNEAEALEDFQEALAELFLTLDGDRESLGPALRDTLRILEAKIRKTA